MSNAIDLTKLTDIRRAKLVRGHLNNVVILSQLRKAIHGTKSEINNLDFIYNISPLFEDSPYIFYEDNDNTCSAEVTKYLQDFRAINKHQRQIDRCLEVELTRCRSMISRPVFRPNPDQEAEGWTDQTAKTVQAAEEKPAAAEKEIRRVDPRFYGPVQTQPDRSGKPRPLDDHQYWERIAAAANAREERRLAAELMLADQGSREEIIEAEQRKDGKKQHQKDDSDSDNSNVSFPDSARRPRTTNPLELLKEADIGTEGPLYPGVLEKQIEYNLSKDTYGRVLMQDKLPYLQPTARVVRPSTLIQRAIIEGVEEQRMREHEEDRKRTDDADVKSRYLPPELRRQPNSHPQQRPEQSENLPRRVRAQSLEPISPDYYQRRCRPIYNNCYRPRREGDNEFNNNLAYRKALYEHASVQDLLTRFGAVVVPPLDEHYSNQQTRNRWAGRYEPEIRINVPQFHCKHCSRQHPVPASAPTVENFNLDTAIASTVSAISNFATRNPELTLTIIAFTLTILMITVIKTLTG